MQAPEQTARGKIDRLLAEAGWLLQDRDGFDRTAVIGIRSLIRLYRWYTHAFCYYS